MDNMNGYEIKGGLGIGIRRFIAYVVLIFVTVMCLFWF